LFVVCDEFAAIHATIRACRIERVSGRWHEERTLLSYATELFAAVKSRMALWSAAEAAVGAWLCANRALLERCVADLNGRIERDDAPALRHLSSSLAGRFDEPNGIESARHLAYAFLAQACHAPDAEGARRCAERADAAAMLAHEPFLSTLTSVARAMCDHSRRLQHLARAVDASELVESPALQQAVRAIIAGDNDAGMLSPLLGMLVQHQYSSGSISIGMASCAIKRNGELLQLSERETALAVAIARRPEPTSAIQLAELLWPDLDEAAGLHAVQTYIHRLRQRFCDPEAIELVAQGYRYRADTKVDLWEMERFIASLPAGPLEHFSALVLAAFVRDLNVSPPGYTIGWEWFISTRLRVEDLVRAAEYRMARDALKAGLLGEALACAKRIIGRDELDEEAWEVVIRCCIAAGDKLAASREFRRYREIVLRELNQEPSKDLRSLIGADA
jgi:DNA-binding SARP family transcriptional activator